jgi:hypothetical protein
LIPSRGAIEHSFQKGKLSYRHCARSRCYEVILISQTSDPAFVRLSHGESPWTVLPQVHYLTLVGDTLSRFVRHCRLLAELIVEAFEYEGHNVKSYSHGPSSVTKTLVLEGAHVLDHIQIWIKFCNTTCSMDFSRID